MVRSNRRDLGFLATNVMVVDDEFKNRAPPPYFQKMKRGALLVFEGVDRCGKTTQTQLLLDRLRSLNVKAELFRFPDRSTATGQIIDTYLKNGVDLDDKAIHLLFAANRWEASKKMVSMIHEGTTLIVDRYSYSGVCFTAAKDNQELAWCMAPEVGLPAPDKIFFLQLEIEESMKRGQFGEERYEKEEFQKEVLQNFQNMVTSKWAVLDASKTIESLSSEIESLSMDVIKNSADLPLGTLWNDS